MPTQRYAVQPSGHESPMGEEEIIVSKTDLKGHVTYANRVFLRVAHMTEKEVLGQPHNIIRHPDMPRCVFKFLWERIQAKQEIFAYVLNMAKTGDYYWVFAHVTPTLDAAQNITGYHSNRRKPFPAQIAIVSALYQKLIEEEKRHTSPKDAVEASYRLMMKTIQETGKSYDEFIFSF